jgi:hypothetical protein
VERAAGSKAKFAFANCGALFRRTGAAGADGGRPLLLLHAVKVRPKAIVIRVRLFIMSSFFIKRAAGLSTALSLTTLAA